MKKEEEPLDLEESPEIEMFNALDQIPKLMDKLAAYHSKQVALMEELRTQSSNCDALLGDLLSRTRRNVGTQCNFPGIRAIADGLAESLAPSLREKLAGVPVKVEHTHVLMGELLKYADKKIGSILTALGITVAVLAVSLICVILWYSGSNACWNAKYLNLRKSQELTEEERKLLMNDKFLNESEIANPWGLYSSEKKRKLKAVMQAVDLRKNVE